MSVSFQTHHSQVVDGKTTTKIAVALNPHFLYKIIPMLFIWGLLNLKSYSFIVTHRIHTERFHYYSSIYLSKQVKQPEKNGTA